ncbi:MAG: hypothetical protein JXR84_09725 [Anaerolineae bacterium]|nr:hypothetical protein [Anaerolineae bacterium]
MKNESLDLTLSCIRNLYEAGNALEAYQETCALLEKNPTNPNIRSYSASFFIDIGSVLRDITIVDSGINLIEELITEEVPDFEDAVRANLEYNLSNGYSTRFRILTEQGETEQAEESLQRSKSLLQSVLLNKRVVDADLVALVMANYANALNFTGRTVEAIDWYMDCLKRYPKHAVAMANSGIAIKRILGVSEPHTTKNLYESWRLLSRASKLEEEALKLAGPSAVEGFRMHLEDLVNKITINIAGGLEELRQWSIHRTKQHGLPKAPTWLMTANQDRLLLTLNLNPLNSTEECIDDLFFPSLVTESGEQGTNRFRKLAHTLNTIKEDYVTARYLFYHCDEAETNLASRGAVTHYANTLDYADYGLAIGLRKASFRLAADCLDKIAILINEYFNLEHNENRVNINNVWYENCSPKKPLHPTLANILQSNPFLAAIRDLQKDWFLQNFPAPLKAARDAATHRRLVLYWMKPTTKTEFDVKWDISDFREFAFFLLRMVKAATIYAVCAITLEEQNRDDTGVFTAPVSFRLGPGLTEMSSG